MSFDRKARKSRDIQYQCKVYIDIVYLWIYVLSYQKTLQHTAFLLLIFSFFFNFTTCTALVYQVIAGNYGIWLQSVDVSHWGHFFAFSSIFRACLNYAHSKEERENEKEESRIYHNCPQLLGRLKPYKS
jgi:hypothetical protein